MADGENEKQKLLQGGFAPSEVAGWEAQKRNELAVAGFKPQEVDDYFGVKATDFTTLDHAVDAAFAPGARVAGNPWDSFLAGVGMGASTLPVHRPDIIQPENAGLFQKIMYGLGQTTSDLPVALFGAVAGGAAMIETGPGAVIGVGAGGMALPTAVREATLDIYRHGSVKSFGDIFSRVSSVLFKTEQAAATGAVAGPLGAKAGELAAPLGKGAETVVNAFTFATSATAVGAALEGRIPSADDFVTGAVLALGPAVAVHYVGKLPVLNPNGKAVQANLEDIYAKTGLTPEEVLNKAKTDPGIKAEMMAPRASDGGFVIPGLEKYAAERGLHDKPEAPQPVPEQPQYDVKVDNPGGDWLKEKQADAAADAAKGRNASGPLTASVRPGPDGVWPTLPVDELLKFPGARGEENAIRQDNVDALAQSMSDKGYDKTAPVTLFVGHDGKVFIGEGNHRVRAAQAAGLSDVPVDVRYFAGGEDAPGPLNLKGFQERLKGGSTAAPFVTPETVPPVHLELFRALEGSADDAVSPAGAIGRYQIMPDTARQYGFDPAHLQDPAYNETVARHIIADLNNKFDGNFADMAVAYNAGPGRARAWIKGGRDFASLPLETQKYLLHAEELGAVSGENFATTDAMHQAEYQGLDPQSWMAPLEGGGGGRKPPLEGDIIPPDEQAPKRIEGTVPTTDEFADRVRDILAPETKKGMLDWLNPLKQITHILDTQLSPARKVDRMMDTDRTNMTIEDQLRQTYGSYGRAGAFIREGIVDLTFDKSGNPQWNQTNKFSWLDAYRSVKAKGGNAIDFLAYRIAARAVEKEGQGIKTGVDMDAARAVLRDPKWRDRYRDGLEILRQGDMAALEYARRAGLYSEEHAARIGSLNENYISFNRVMDDNYNPSNLPGRGFRPRKPINAMSGSKRQIIDPESNTISNRMTLIAMADRNIALQRVIDMVAEFNAKNPDKAFGLQKDEKLSDVAVRDMQTGKLLHAELLDEQGNPIPAATQQHLTPFLLQRQLGGRMTPDHFIIFRNGVPEVWRATDPAMADMIRMALPGKGDIATNLLTQFAGLQRAGIATDLGFALRTLTYGQFTAAAFAEKGTLVPFSDIARGAMDAWFGNGKVWEDWRANGGAGAALADIDHRYIKADTDTIFNKTGVWQGIINFAAHPIEAFRHIVSSIHAAAQVGFYAHARNAGVPAPRAAMLSRQAYLDSAEGMAMSSIQRFTTWAPFLHTSLLDLHQVGQGVRDRPLSFVGRAALVLMAPTILNILANVALENANNTPERDRYFNRPRWVRDLYWSLPAVNGANFQVKAPPSTGTFLFKVLPERFMEYLWTHDRASFDDMMTTFGSMAMPAPIPTIATPVIENWANRSFQNGRPIVPASLQNNSGWMQYGPTTSETAKALARLLGPQSPVPVDVSPYMIENWVKGYTGTAPIAALKQLEAAFDPIKKASDIADLPFIGQFFVRKWGAGQALDDFYTRYKDLQTAHADFALAVKRNDLFEINATIKGQAFLKVTKAYQAITNATAVQRAVNDNPDMTADEKRQSIDGLADWTYATARYGLLVMKSIE